MFKSFDTFASTFPNLAHVHCLASKHLITAQAAYRESVIMIVFMPTRLATCAAPIFKIGKFFASESH